MHRVKTQSHDEQGYVLTYAGSTLAVIDGATGTVTKTLSLATHPSSIAVNSQTHQIYIGNQNTASVLVLDGETNRVVTTVKTGNIPYAMALDAAANQVYVANFSSSNATIIAGPVVATAQWPPPPKFRVVALAERGGDHQTFVDAVGRRLRSRRSRSTSLRAKEDGSGSTTLPCSVTSTDTQ